MVEVVISTLTDVIIDKGNAEIRIKTYYHNFAELPNTVLAFVNFDIPNLLFDYVPFKVCEAGVKMINHPIQIDFNINKAGELVVFGPDQDDIDNYSLGGVNNQDLVYTT